MYNNRCQRNPSVLLGSAKTHRTVKCGCRRSRVQNYCKKNEINHQPRNLVIYGSNSVLVPIRNKRQRFLIPQLSCLVFIFRPTFKIDKLGIITVAFPMAIAQKVSLGERQDGQKLQISLRSKYTKEIRDLLTT